jgi:ankyrin repeat protein
VSLTTRESDKGTLVQLELAHFSVKEYLTSERLPEPFQHKFSQAYARGHMTRSCLAYLSCLKDEDSSVEVATQFPLAQYSAEYWIDHARHSETLDIVGESILDFFENNTAYTVWGRLFHPESPWKFDSNPFNGCPLYLASLVGLDATVHKLLQRGADVNAQGGNHGSALQAASYHGHYEIVQMLLDKGADVNAQGGYHGNALRSASSRGYYEIVQVLLDKGADVNAQGGYLGNALQSASSGGHYEIVQMLLDKGADVNAQGGEYSSALSAASHKGHDKIVQLLLENNANVNAQDGEYGNALQAASFSGHYKLVQMLLDKGANVNAQARFKHKLFKVHAMLRGRKIANKDDFANSLQAASYRGYNKIVRLLLENGADVNAQGGEYGNALQAASHQGHDKIVQMLLENGAQKDLNING